MISIPHGWQVVKENVTFGNRPKDVKLDYAYDGDLLISLSKGDYIIYYPSAEEGEMLKLMDSELHVIRDAGEGSELYFEIEQEKA